MFDWLERKLYPRLKNKEFRSNDELYMYLLTQVAVLFAITMHAFLFVILLMTGARILIVASMLSLLIFIINYMVLLQKKVIRLSALILAADVILFTLIVVVCVGSSSYSILYLVVLMILQVILPYSRLWVRILVLFIIWLCMILTYVLPMYFEPLYEIGRMKPVLAIFNIQLGFFGVATELLIGNLLRKVIEDYNAKQFRSLESEANTDPLTGLYNRRFAREAFGKIAREEGDKSYCTAMLDIDDFKQINDLYGHAAGDEVLRALAKTLQCELRKTDLLFRWGGEEFLILLVDVPLPTAQLIMEKVRVSLADKAVRTGQVAIRFTVTIGLSELDKKDILKSISHSDKLMYEGKRNGKNQVVV
ncbi:GGDEF domain-containing protein [Ruminococcaceae bacterium OttesenSCG-928-I18]|nr:GGDEF domain-containing protein [Ruminococcaceae bacterium OttesenSCG-928-I18]